jgi:hypothetical protein
MDPAPINPSPPALLTAEARRQPLHQTIPACMMEYLVEKSEEILLVIEKKRLGCFMTLNSKIPKY